MAIERREREKAEALEAVEQEELLRAAANKKKADDETREKATKVLPGHATQACLAPSQSRSALSSFVAMRCLLVAFQVCFGNCSVVPIELCRIRGMWGCLSAGSSLSDAV